MDKAMRRITKSVLDKIAKIGHLHARETSNGNWEIYNKKTGEVIETVSKEDADSAVKRFEHKEAQRNRKRKGTW
jgi:hypothetical protein